MVGNRPIVCQCCFFGGVESANEFLFALKIDHCSVFVSMHGHAAVKLDLSDFNLFFLSGCINSS